MTEPHEALSKWSTSSGAWIRAMRRGEANRERLLDPPMLELAGDVTGLDVLDVGCGEGRFCRMLAARGARTVGLDPTPEFLAEARHLDPEGSYVEGVGERLPFEEASFDLVVSYLTIIDIPDFRAAIREMARVLRPGGRLLVATVNSFASTRPRAWYQDENGEKLHVAVVDYFDEKEQLLEWSGMSIINWHRPFEAYMEAYLSAGLILEQFREPRPTLSDVDAVPSMIDEYRVPIFHVMRWRKPQAS
ncbi:class I SAM-dependent methyltransferase [Fimbriimonas ginsengisoli]|uniref:Methyltransferase, putative n=1 Tax=Fimbriimonas ginsengisoli Gsoil 348 TaxID=661478 RepID=A0A068NUK4_FIMGI|nr:class I SAM-dependent methyltransferase [Fimbriimonas ginsengisoli]AIE87213.1 methyltransferase, putative [Fimbriimonas ginsengisoli Gsoil 348]